MRIRESGMPPEDYWNSFFDTEFILNELFFDHSVKDAAEFGSGYGTFSIPAAKKIKGTLYAFDIDDGMVETLNQKISSEQIKNIEIFKRDFVEDGTALKNDSVDYVMMFNILHTEEPVNLLNEAKRILKKDGRLGIIHWIYSGKTPRGPSMDIRPTETQIVEWLKIAGFEILKYPFPLPPFHYGIVSKKTVIE